jgi:gamma-butyrobetaine dioxygenase
MKASRHQDNPIELTASSLRLAVDGQPVTVPYVWLRDNEPAAFHHRTRERNFDLLTLPQELRPVEARISDGALVVAWPDLPRPRHYALDWLAAHAPGRRRPDPADVPPAAWPDGFRPARFDAADAAENGGLLDLLAALKREGLIVVAGLEGPDAGVAFGERIGFRRRSNFGETFDVVSMPDPNNQAYTADDLDLHTDLPNQLLVPGYQFLHCVRNTAAGGDSMFADGFRILDDFRRAEGGAYRLLRDVEVPFRFHDDGNDLRVRRSVIECDRAGRPVRMAFNPGILDIVDLPDGMVEDWYGAWRALRRAVAGHPCRIRFRLAEGDMAVFDNSRILHGRTRFNPQSGHRHLRGYYIDRGEVDSRMRVTSGAHRT